MLQLYLHVWPAGGHRQIVETLLERDGPMTALDPHGEFPKRGASFPSANRWVRVRNVYAPASARKVDEHVQALDEGREQSISVVMWGAHDPFVDHSGHERALRTSRHDVEDVFCSLLLPEMDAGCVVPFVEAMLRRMPIVTGAAWGGVPLTDGPPWIGSRYSLPKLREPLLPGPFWVTVAPPDAHRALVADRSLVAAAREVREVVVDGELRGGVWRLSDSTVGPEDDELEAWMAALADLHLLA